MGGCAPSRPEDRVGGRDTGQGAKDSVREETRGARLEALGGDTVPSSHPQRVHSVFTLQ